MARLPPVAALARTRSGTGAIGVRAVITPADIKGVPLAAKFDIRALKLRAALDWKFDEYDPEKPAPRGKSRHSLLGRSRHQRGAAVDEAKRRPRLWLYRQPRPARRDRLRRDSAQGLTIRRRKSPAGGLPHAIGARRYCRHPIRRLPHLHRRHHLLQ